MNLSSRVAILIILSISVISCGSNNSNQQQSSNSKSFGSWSTMVGGTLSLTSAASIDDISSINFYRIYMPAGLGITHEFIGVEIHTADGMKLYRTTGLVGDADDAYFKNNFHNGSAVRLIKSFKRSSSSKAIIFRINRMMKNSLHNNQAYYLAAMTSTPLFGRPCANVATKIEQIL